jgi:excisionase family DNA binding protein
LIGPSVQLVERPAPMAVEPDPRVALTIPDVAKLLAVHPNTVMNRIRDGSIPTFRIGRLVRISPATVDALMRGEHP